MTSLLQLALAFAAACVVLAILFCVIRLLIGPTAHDRVLALDTMWMCSMMLVLLFGIRFGHSAGFEVALLIALVGFVSTVALAKFLMRGEIIE